MFADVSLSFGNFLYYIPKRLLSHVKIGSLVEVPVKNNYFKGIVIKIKEGANIKKIKKIKKICYPEPLIDSSFIELSKELAHYYFTEMGSFLELMIPSIGKSKPSKVNIEEMPLPKIDVPCPLFIKKAINENKFKYILIHGDSREKIYLSAINETIKRGLGVIFLSPEINLSNQVYSNLQKVFGERVVLYHSRLKKESRWLNWLRIKYGIAKIVVGSMNAVFSPIDKLGLIIVDDENSPTYKSEKYPKYSAKFVAFMRAKLSNCVCIYGSSVPSIESYYNAKDSIIRLEEKYGSIHIVDMKKENNSILSVSLTDKIKKYIDNKEKILLFINRRGFCSFLLCNDCGYVPKCKNCDVSLTYHKENYKLRCHYCGYEEAVFDVCPHCRGVNISYKGIGTARVESYIKKKFPNVKIFRVDRDTVSPKYLMRILNSFVKGDIQILLGTQMIAQMIDFIPPNDKSIGLIGIISADYGLNIPDFRASEYIYSIITKLCQKGKEIIIQTYNIKHPVIRHISNYTNFYEEELRLRKAHNYPPYTHLIRLVVEGTKKAQVKNKSQKLYDKLILLNKNIEILGPVPCFVSYKKNKYRYHLLIKTDTPANIKLPKEVKPQNVCVDIDPIDFI